MDLSQKIRKWQAEEKIKKTPDPKVVPMKSNRSWMRQLAAAASVLIAVGFGFLLFTGGESQEETGKRNYLFENFEVRNDRPSAPEYLRPALELKDAGHPEKALENLEELSKINPDGSIKTLIADIHFEQGNYDTAAEVLEEILKNSTSTNVKRKTEMKLLMTYLADSRMEDFEKLKSEILATGSEAQKIEIKKLDKELSGLWGWFSK